MSDHPYLTLPHRAFWNRALGSMPMADVDPVGQFAIAIGSDTRVATAGSCFAQHIARHLKNSGYHHYVPEPGHPILPDYVREEQGYGLFSCRYGNIYTARQLWQLFERAYGRFEPKEDIWLKAPDVVIDPFRPTVQPGGFISEAEMRGDRSQHLAAVRRMFETLDVFVFTLGLTECWRSSEDGAVFPLCPGTEAGEFDADKHEFFNETVDDVVSDLTAFCTGLAAVNPKAQIVLTVSPVPLAATAEPGEHVLSATTYSKSVLRVAAETICRSFTEAHYFPSFEIITGNFNRGRYYAADLRNVVEPGVEHVMRLFMRHAANAGSGPTRVPATDAADYMNVSERLIEVECDEIALVRR